MAPTVKASLSGLETTSLHCYHCLTDITMLCYDVFFLNAAIDFTANAMEHTASKKHKELTEIPYLDYFLG